MDDHLTVEKLLAAQSIGLDEASLLAVADWHRAWSREWERVQALDLRDDDLPAPLWCWPP